MVDVAAGHATGSGYAYRPAALTSQTGQVSSGLTVEWDFDNDGDFSESVEDITGYVLNGDYGVGRDYPSQLLGRSTPGTLRLTLNNSDNRFSYFNTSSPVNTAPYSLKNGRRIRVRTTESAPVEPTQLARDRFAGFGTLNGTDTEDGLTWSVPSGALSRSAGRVFVTGTPANASIAVVDVGVDDYYAQVTIPFADRSNTVGLVFRYVDDDNYEVLYPSYSQGWQYISRVAGADSAPSFALHDLTGTITIGIEVVGQVGTVYIAGVPVTTFATIGTTGSLVGLYGLWTAQRAPQWEEFAVWDTVRVPQDGVVWSGTVTSVQPTRNTAGVKTAALFAEGDLARLDRTINAPTSIGVSDGLSPGKTAGQVIGEVLSTVGLLHPPHPLAAGDIPLGGIGAAKIKAINAARKAEEAELGFVYEPPEGGIRFDARSARDRSTPVATFTDSPGNATEIAPERSVVRTSMRDIVNRVTSEVSPSIPRLINVFGNIGDTAAASPNDVAIIVPGTGDGAQAGDLVLATFVSTVQTDGVPWLNPTGWTNLRPTYDEPGLIRVYAKRIETGDLGTTVKFYDDTSSGGAWLAFVDLFRNWHGDVTSGVAIAGPTGYGLPHTAATARLGTNDPPALLTPWAPSPTLYITYRGGMAASTGTGAVDAASQSRAPNGWYSNANFFLNATAGGAYDVALERAVQNNSTGIGDPSPFTGTFTGFDYLESVTLAVRPYAGDPPPVSGGVEVEANNVASQHDHGAIVEHRDPATIFSTSTDAATYNNYLLRRFDQDRPIVTFGFTATKSYHHRAAARALRLSDRVRYTDSDEGVDGEFYVEAIRGSFSTGDRLWDVEYDLSPVLDPGGGADANDGTGDTEEGGGGEVAQLDVYGIEAASGVDEQTVTNPLFGVSGGGTLLCIAAATGPSNEATSGSAFWVAPSGGLQVFNYAGSAFVSRVRCWLVESDGTEADVTFGWETNAGNPCTCVVVGLTGDHIDYDVTASPSDAGGTTSSSYPTLTTEVGWLALACSVSQVGDDLTVGPSGYTEEFNNTAALSSRGVAVFSDVTESTSVTPGNSTWSASAGAHIQWVFSFTNGGTSGGGGGGGAGPTAARISNANLLVDLDATDITTWGKDRAEGQWVVGGGRFNPGLDDNWNSLVWEADDSTIEGAFTMQDGNIERLQQSTYAGITVVETAFQYVEDGSYTYQAGQDNTSVNSPPTDELYFDGNRSTMSHIAIGIPVGPGADPTVIGVSFVVEPWMFADDYTSCPWSLHSPTVYHTGPIGNSIRSGTLSLSGKYSTTAIDPDSTTNLPGSWGAPASVTLPPVGEWVTSVVEFIDDPGGTGYLNWYTLNHTTGEMVTVAEMGNTWGWIFDEADGGYVDQNNEFYLNIPAHYQFHQYTPPGVTNNWDRIGAGGSNVRRLRWPYAAASQSVTAEQMIGHAKYFLGID